MKPSTTNPDLPRPPAVWEYTDYRLWLNDLFQARKAVHSWYSYGVLAQKAGFQARDYLLRVMRGDRGLSPASAEKLADALDLRSEERNYFLALVLYNQSKRDAAKELAWSNMQHALRKSRNASERRLITGAHRQVLSSWQHLVVRSLLELRPDPGDWTAIGKRLRPRRSKASVRRSIGILQKCGLVEKRDDGLWYATDKSIATNPEVSFPAVRQFHRHSLKLASESLERFPPEHRNLSGMVLGISRSTYAFVIERLTRLRKEIAQVADNDTDANAVYQLTLALFPLTDVPVKEDAP